MQLGDQSRTEAARRDAADPLAHLRTRYHLPAGLVYLAGNSLGPAPLGAFAEMATAMRMEWAEGLVGSWNHAGWFELPGRLGDRLGRLIGAAPGQVVVTDSVSVNLFKVLHAAVALQPERSTIVAEAGSFPTDLYIAQGLTASRPGLQLRLQGIDAPQLEDLIDADTAVVLVNHVDYRTGELRDMAALTRLIHERGAIAIWDLCHSAGVLEVELDAAAVDFAVGCTYKYLNCGPGAPAFIYAATRHHAAMEQPLSGWWGHKAPFDFDYDYQPAPGIQRMLTGTQPILSLRMVAAGLAAFDGVTMAELRAKSLGLTDWFIELVEPLCAAHGAELVVPRDHARRGGQVSIRLAQGYPVMQALIAQGIVGDFRAPDIMRFGFPPAYLTFAEVERAAATLAEILATGSWQQPRFQSRGAVT